MLFESKKVALAATVCLLAFIVTGKAQAGPMDECTSGDTERMLKGCAVFIARGGMTSDLAIAHHNRGLAYARKGKDLEAIDDFTKTIQYNPKDVSAWYNRGLGYESLDRFEEALADFTQYIKLRPKEADGYNERGIVYEQMKKYDLALADYNKGLQLDPKDAIVYHNRGGLYLKLKQLDKALADMNRSIELNPKSVRARFVRGGVYHEMKQYVKAIADYRTAVALDPKGEATAAQYEMGESLEALGKKEEAIAAYKKAIEQNTRVKDAQESLKRLGTL